MRSSNLKNLTTRLLATSALVALIAGAPATINIDPDSYMIVINPSLALAKDGDSSGSGGGGGDSSGSGSGGDGGGDSSGSGSGGDGGGDNSGSGSSGSGGDDNSGPGSSNSGDSDDDNSVSGSSGSEIRTADGVKVEINGDNIEITFPDGTKQEIENGVFERKNAAGRTVEERPATQSDIDSLGAAATALGNSASVEREFTRPDGTKVEVTGNNIEVEFADGWKEEIENGRFEMKDPNGNTVIERPATDEDRARLEGQISG